MHDIGRPERNVILCIEGCFHGRTLSMLSATSKVENRVGFGPLPKGFRHVNFNNLDSLENHFQSDDIAAIMIEPVLGEGGAKSVSKQFFSKAQKLAKKYKCLIISDEVQTGIGRLGTLFGYQTTDLHPDIMAIAKGLGGGVPIGAVLATKKVASAMKPGSHGSTFGGNPLAMSVGNAVLDQIFKKGFLKNVQKISKYFHFELNKIKNEYPKIIKEVRGVGLLIGLQLFNDQTKFIKKLMDNKLLTIRAAENVIRILPPLNVKKNEIDLALKIIRKVCKEYKI